MILQKKLTFFFAVLLGLMGINSAPGVVKADDIDDLPVVTLGDSLTKSQREETIKTLIQPINDSNYQAITVTGNDLVKYLNPSGDNFAVNSGVWSSALIQKTAKGSGINAKIVPYNGQLNITTITADQYKNAAVTAGISDANIYVTSAIPIDGSGALAGVYAAYAKQNKGLNQKQINAAQDEMGTLSSITKKNKDKTGYSDDKLNKAVAGAKSQMAQQGQNISNSKIRDIVNNQININHLGNTINNNQKEQIIKLLEEVRDSGALKNGNFQKQASLLTSDLSKVAKKLNTSQNRNFLQKLIDSLVSFVRGLLSHN